MQLAAPRAFGGGRGFAPHSWTERLGALCLPLLWSLPLPSLVSGSTAAPPPDLRAAALRRVRAGRSYLRFAAPQQIA